MGLELVNDRPFLLHVLNLVEFLEAPGTGAEEREAALR
jgi:hypothetical protein